MTAGTERRRTAPAAAPARRRRWTFDRVSFMAVFLGLPLLIFVVFVIVPFVQAVYYSFTDWGGFSPDKDFIGLQNYVDLFHDDLFMHAVRNVALLGFIVPLVTIVTAIVLASFVTVGGPSSGRIRGVRGAGFYRAVSFFPFCIPAIVIGLIWAQMYDPSSGLLNGFLTQVGLHDFANFPWLGEVSTAMPATMFVIVWGFIGFYTVLFVAAIKGIPAEVFEAARLDGAGRFRTIVSITLPTIRDTVQTAYIYLGIAALDSFVYVAALFPNAGGPANSTLTITQDLFSTAFTRGQFGYATAMGVVLALITLAFAGVVAGVNRLSKGRSEGRA